MPLYSAPPPTVLVCLVVAAVVLLPAGVYFWVSEVAFRRKLRQLRSTALPETREMVSDWYARESAAIARDERAMVAAAVTGVSTAVLLYITVRRIFK